MDIKKIATEKMVDLLIKKKIEKDGAEILIDNIDDKETETHIIKYLKKKGYEPKIVDGNIVF